MQRPAVRTLLATAALLALACGVGVAQMNPAAQSASPPDADCVIPSGYAATVLVPYFVTEVDSFNLATLVTVANGTSFDTLARVVMWTDWGVPTLAFDIYLDPFGMVQINTRDLFDGIVPSTGSTSDLSSFPFCGSLPPYHTNPVLTSDEGDQLAAWHSGLGGPLDSRCAGLDHGDGLARGYLTIDVVDECSGVEAVDPVFTPVNTSYPYFADGGGSGGIAIAENRLWADVAIIDNANNFAQAAKAVGIWADPNQFTVDGTYTFYGRYSGWDTRDDRVPVPWEWSSWYLNGAPFSGGGAMIVWRDTESPDASPITCGVNPSWWPLTGLVTAQNDDSSASETLPADSFPAATQMTSLDELNASYNNGIIFISGDSALPMWVQPNLSAFGRYSATFTAAAGRKLCGTSVP